MNTKCSKKTNKNTFIIDYIRTQIFLNISMFMIVDADTCNKKYLLKMIYEKFRETKASHKNF